MNPKNEIMLLNAPTQQEYDVLLNLSRIACSSGLYAGVGGEQKIFMILLAAREMHIPPMQALNGGIWNIQGKIEISARLMGSMIRRAGHSIVSVECNDKICILKGTRCDNSDSFTAQFSIEEAARAGLTSRSVWKSYTEDMLYARAMSRLARRLFPDVIGMAYVEGEIRDSQNPKKREKTTEEPVIELKCEELAPHCEENEETRKYMIANFVSKFEFDPDEIETYLTKYATYWKKTLASTLEDYVSDEKFISDFSKWKRKEERSRT